MGSLNTAHMHAPILDTACSDTVARGYRPPQHEPCRCLPANHYGPICPQCAEFNFCVIEGTRSTPAKIVDCMPQA